MIVHNQKVKVKWNGANRKYYESFGYVYTKSGNEFEIDINHITKGSNSIVEFECDWCHKHFNNKYKTAMRYDHQFCSNDCQHKFNSKTKLEARPWKKCEWCDQEYQIPYYAEETSRFCSRKCLTKWQSKAFKSEGSSRYVKRIIVNCDWCNESIERTEYELSMRMYNFCNRECQRNWHREVFVKSEKFIEINKQTMINNLINGKISSTQSKPQLILNELLDNNKIKYINEKSFNEFSIDVYLEDFDLYIEVNGGFWHCDNRFYDEINYDMQLSRIKSDKIKKAKIKNKLNKDILYLWEFDIETNLELCHKLILKYIENDGILDNYHSFNYSIDKDGHIRLEKEIIKPYMDWKINDLAKIIDLSVREKVNKYQPEKHITFNCEQCGNEKTQNKNHYERSKHHFCSVECKNLFQQKIIN
jgi:hypothetical protein